MKNGESPAKATGLSPNDITPREATPRRVVAQLPVPVGVATRRHLPARLNWDNGHPARCVDSPFTAHATGETPVVPVRSRRSAALPHHWNTMTVPKAGMQLS